MRMNRCWLWVALLFVCGCDTHCISESSPLWEPDPGEYRLLVTNNSSSMVEIRVDGESLGIYCSGVQQVPVGNFSQRECSQIQAEFFDNPGTIELDDCSEGNESECLENNIDGRICYDTSYIEQVLAEVD